MMIKNRCCCFNEKLFTANKCIKTSKELKHSSCFSESEYLTKWFLKIDKKLKFMSFMSKHLVKLYSILNAISKIGWLNLTKNMRTFQTMKSTKQNNNLFIVLSCTQWNNEWREKQIMKSYLSCWNSKQEIKRIFVEDKHFFATSISYSRNKNCCFESNYSKREKKKLCA